MKIYDKVLVPAKAPKIFSNLGSDAMMAVTHNGPVIVASVVELRDLWNAAAEAMDEVIANQYDDGYVRKKPDFDEYLKSKGITI